MILNIHPDDPVIVGVYIFNLNGHWLMGRVPLSLCRIYVMRIEYLIKTMQIDNLSKIYRVRNYKNGIYFKNGPPWFGDDETSRTPDFLVKSRNSTT